MTVPLEITVILQRVLHELDDISLPSLQEDEVDDDARSEADEYWFVDSGRRVSCPLITIPDVLSPPLTLSRWKSCDALSSRTMPNPRLPERPHQSTLCTSVLAPTITAPWEGKKTRQHKNSLLGLSVAATEHHHRNIIQSEECTSGDGVVVNGNDTAAAVMLPPPTTKRTTRDPPRLPKRTWKSKQVL